MGRKEGTQKESGWIQKCSPHLFLALFTFCAFVENALQEVMLELQHPGGMPQQIIFSETFLINVGRFAFFVAAFIT